MRRFKDWVDKQAKIEFGNRDRWKQGEVCLIRGESLKKEGGNLEGIIRTTWGHAGQKSEPIFS